MDPLAYDLRDHAIFDAPFKIDRTKTTTIPTPKDFQDVVKAATIQIIPLVNDVNAHWPMPGWCTYTRDFAENPDLEVFSGGVNHKTPAAAGLWRQGNLLHFGFEQSPADLNEVGQHMLLNSIAYISRFTQDRPIAYTPSVFAGKVAPSRIAIPRRLADPSYRIEWVTEAFAPALAKELDGHSREYLVKWAQTTGLFLRPNADAQLEFDADLQALNIPFDDQRFLDAIRQAITLDDHPDQARTRRLIQRYLPPETHKLADAALAAWLAENRPYLFPSDAGDYKWYIDPLAKVRKTPTKDLRGPARADADH
jgi:hypothetical protein